MKQGDILHGFKVYSVQELPELKAVLYKMKYEKNGAELVWLDNGEANKLFSIAFKTLPKDDTGVFHILEHSVLCGSDKYPVKEPFLDLLKSSMNTFLNAMTFPDKTVYPVSSKNEQDFLNLMQVYLDAVFCPAIYHNPNIFRQEGWHYEPNGDEMIYKGVVFNEMKGALSSEDSLIEDGMNKLLFPNNCYRFVSGGDPKKIPELTYEQFTATHKEFYHPTNAKIYLDGSVPINKVLTILDEEYLSKYEHSGVKHEIAVQKPVPAAELEEYYAIGEDMDTKGMTHAAACKLLCDFTDRKAIYAVMILSSYLTGSNEAPLKQAILQNGLGEDVSLSVMDGIAQPYVFLRVYNTDRDKCDEIKRVISDTIEKVLKDGLDKEELEAAINRMEFNTREGEEPQGLLRNINALSSWLYGGEPEMYLLNDELFEDLRNAIDTDYYDKLLRFVLLDKENTCWLYLLPSKTKGAEDAEEERGRLAAVKASLSEQDYKKIVEENDSLLKWQSDPDSPEALATLPVLSIDEVDPLPEKLGTENTALAGVPVMFHKVSESGVVHFNLYFSLSDYPIETAGDISLITELIGKLPTKNKTVTELRRRIKHSIGILDYNVSAYAVPEHSDRCRPYFTVNCSVLKNKLPEAIKLISEILTDTVYEGERSAGLIKELFVQCNEWLRRSISDNGHSFALKRAMSRSTASDMYREQVSGFDLYRRLSGFVNDFDSRITDYQSFVQSLVKNVFTASRLIMSVAADELPKELAELINAFEKGMPAPEYLEAKPKKSKKQTLVKIPSMVSYASSAGNLANYNAKYNGSFRVLSTVLSYDYLWNKIRVQGGAYGCGFQAGYNGNMGFYSYRDPDPKRSAEIFAKTADYIREFANSDEDIVKYIISTIASTQPLMTLRESCLKEDTELLSGITYDDKVRTYKQMLSTDKEKLLSCAGLFEEMAEQNDVCIFCGAQTAGEFEGDWEEYSI